MMNETNSDTIDLVVPETPEHLLKPLHDGFISILNRETRRRLFHSTLSVERTEIKVVDESHPVPIDSSYGDSNSIMDGMISSYADNIDPLGGSFGSLVNDAGVKHPRDDDFALRWILKFWKGKDIDVLGKDPADVARYKGSVDLVVPETPEHICYPVEDNDLIITKRKARRSLFDVNSSKKNKSSTMVVESQPIDMGLSDVDLKSEIDGAQSTFCKELYPRIVSSWSVVTAAGCTPPWKEDDFELRWILKYWKGKDIDVFGTDPTDVAEYKRKAA